MTWPCTSLLCIVRECDFLTLDKIYPIVEYRSKGDRMYIIDDDNAKVYTTRVSNKRTRFFIFLGDSDEN